MAEGNRIKTRGGMPGSGLRIVMSEDALSVLKILSDTWSLNGIIKVKNGMSCYSKRDFYRVNLRGCGWWKDSSKGIENNRHAIRGYFEGDGCLWTNKVTSKGKKYAYYRAAFWFHPDQLWMRDWVKSFLVRNKIEITETIKRRAGKCDLYEINIQRDLSVRKLSKLLYNKSEISFKKRVE